MRDFPPTNERRSQGLLTHLRTVTTRALGGSTAKKYAPHTPPETHPVQNSPRAAGPGAHPVQNSPRTPTPAAQPVQNSPNTPKIAHFSPFCPSRENFVPHQQPNRYKTLPAQPVQALTRYKTLPTRPRQQPNRYKTLPTRPKRPISASFARAGRTLSRSHHHDPQQGELCPAPSAKPGTKLSQHTHTSSPTGTKLSQHAQKGPFQPVLPEQGELCTARTTTTPSRENFVPHQAPNPVQNSPHTPTKAHFSPFYPSRENFLPHPEPNPVQNSPNTPPASSPPGTKLSQHAQKGPFQPVLPEQGELCTALTPTPPSRENFVPLSPSRCPAGRTLYRSHHHDAQQGELCTAPSTTPGTKLSQHTHTSSPTGTKLSPHIQKSPFQPVLHEQGELCTASTTTTPAGRTLYRTSSPTGTKLSPFSRSIGPTGTKLSQHTPPAAQPVQNSPHTPKKAHFSPFCPSRENFVPLPPPCPPAGRTLYRFHPHDPQQGELCTAPRANPGTKLSLLSRSRRSPGTKLSPLTHTSSPPGTKLSPHTHKGPFQPVLPEQGELCTALTPTMPSRENFVPRPAPNPVQNSPNTHRPTSLPRISSPSTPKNGVFRLFCACWASFVAHKQPTGHAGRVFSRSMVRTDSPGGSFHWDRLLEPMSVAHGCDNGETTAGGASLRCLLRRVGAWPGSTRTIQTRPIGGCHVADRAWQQHPSAVAGPGPASRRRTKPTSKPRDGPRSDRAWLRRPWVPEGPGRASRSTTPSRQARVWRSRGQATAHRCHPRAHQAARPHRHAPPDTRHQTRAENTSGATTTDTTKRAGTSRFRPALDAQ